MPYDTGLAKRLRDEGLDVVEVPGWKTRGSSTFFPKGAVTHHTAGAHDRPGARTPSLRICVNGRSDLAGPLCNVYQGYDGKVYVVAAGRANHAGTPDGGSHKGMTGNTTAWGLEVEHPGTFPLPPDMAKIAARIQAAVIRGTATAGMVVYHKEWAPSRKPDLATAPSPDAHRNDVAFYLKHTVRERNERMKLEWFRWVRDGRIRGDRPNSVPKKVPARWWDEYQT